jgi:hypothetical protein
MTMPGGKYWPWNGPSTKPQNPPPAVTPPPAKPAPSPKPEVGRPGYGGPGQKRQLEELEKDPTF